MTALGHPKVYSSLRSVILHAQVPNSPQQEIYCNVVNFDRRLQNVGLIIAETVLCGFPS